MLDAPFRRLSRTIANHDGCTSCLGRRSRREKFLLALEIKSSWFYNSFCFESTKLREPERCNRQADNNTCRLKWLCRLKWIARQFHSPCFRSRACTTIILAGQLTFLFLLGLNVIFDSDRESSGGSGGVELATMPDLVSLAGNKRQATAGEKLKTVRERERER